MRIQGSPEQTQYLKSASDQGYLDEVFSALDALGQTPWQINREVFDVVSQVWNSGEALADIPVDNAESKISDPVAPSTDAMKDPRTREAHRVQMKTVRNERAKAHSQRCNLNYKLEIAKAVSMISLLSRVVCSLYASMSTRPFTFLTISTSEAALIPSHLTCRT